MTLPSDNFKIRVGPYTIDVVYRGQSTSEHSKDNYGTFDFAKLEISLVKRFNKNPQQLTNTFLHEVFHAVYEISGLGVMTSENRQNETVGGVNQEIITDRMATVWQEFIQDNEFLFK